MSRASDPFQKLFAAMRRQLRPESPTPLYLQLRGRMERAISAGALAAGEALPSERIWAEALGLSRVTVRKAMDGLADAGLVTRRRGAGCFVAADPRPARAFAAPDPASGPRYALVGAHIFDGEAFHEGRAVLVEAGHIVDLPRPADLPRSIERRNLAGLLAPGFIDTQVNGGGGVLFNEKRSVAGIAAIAAAHRRYGTTGMLPTFITDARKRMAEAVAAVEAAVVARVPGILGLHLEGPFINPLRRGVHLDRYIRPLGEADIALALGFKAGRLMMTLAPEEVPEEGLRRLANGGVIVSIGHTAADYETTRNALRAGATGFTHLFNAMPPFEGRAPGPVGAALDSAECYVGVIVDGHHVDPASLRVALAARGAEHVMLVTDAMPPAGTSAKAFKLYGKPIRRHAGRLTNQEGRLAGSDLTMDAALRNAVTLLGQPLGAALRMASMVPARFLGLERSLGRIAPGYRADMVLLSNALAVRATWIGGHEERYIG